MSLAGIASSYSQTALAAGHYREDATEAALCLLEVGATVLPVDGAGRTALHAAAEVRWKALHLPQMVGVQHPSATAHSLLHGD